MANADVMPYYVNSLRRYGIGYTEVKSPLVMKRDIKEDSETLEVLSFNFKEEITTCEITFSSANTGNTVAKTNANAIKILTFKELKNIPKYSPIKLIKSIYILIILVLLI